MAATTPEQTLTDYLTTLKGHYQQALTEAEAKVSYYREQLSHVNALLVEHLVPSHKMQPAQVQVEVPPVLALSAQVETMDNRPTFELDEEVEDFLAQTKPARPPKAKADTEKQKPAIAQGKRSPRPLLPVYQGLKRLEAIAKVLETTPGQPVTRDSLIQALFGNLSPADHKAERKSLNTLLYKGTKQKLWQKGTTPSSYLIGESKTSQSDQPAPSAAVEPPTTQAKAPTSKAKAASTPEQRLTLALLPAYEGLNKLEAIKKVLTEQSGHVLHQDTLFQLLYGDVSPEVLKEESRRMRASLVQGVTKGLWEKASNQPSSYRAKDSTTRKPNAAAEPIENGTEASPAPKASARSKAGKGSQKVSKPKRNQAELVALLRKADIEV